MAPRRQQANAGAVDPERIFAIIRAKGEPPVALHHRTGDGTFKRIWWTLPDGRRGLGGMPTRDLPLFGSEILADQPPGATVVVVEGEPGALALRSRGYCALATVTGAATTPCAPSLEVLRGFAVVLWGDDDQPGAAHMAKIAERLDVLSIPARVIEWTGATEKGDDAFDFLERGGTDEDLARLIAQARPFAPPTPSLEDFDADAVGRAHGEEPPPEPPRTRLHEMRGDEVLATLSEADHLAHLRFFGIDNGPFVRGWSHAIAAAPKTGKTTLITHLVREWCGSGLSVVYVTEEQQAVWAARLAAMQGDWKTRLHLVFGLGFRPADLVERALGGCEDVVIIDTVRNLVPVKDENDNSVVAATLNPLIARARKMAKTLILIVHERKGGGAHGEGIAGGHALLGVVDVGIELIRDGTPSRRRLRTLARIFVLPDLVYESVDDGQLRLLGDPATVSAAEVGHRILAVLGDEWQKTAEVRARLTTPQPSDEQVRKVLVNLAQRGEIQRDPAISGGAAAGKTHRWRLPNLTSNHQNSPLEEVGATPRKHGPHLQRPTPIGGREVSVSSSEEEILPLRDVE